MARPVPVLPEVGSMIVPPGRSRPSRSAASTMVIATRSLIEPPGLKYSTLPTSCGPQPAAIRLRRTSGVSPTVSSRESLISAAGIRRLYGRGLRRLVARLPARQLGLLDRRLLDHLGQRVVRHRARDLGHVGDLGGGDAGTRGHDAED